METASLPGWEELFRTQPVAEIRQLEARLRRETATHASELHQLVGSRHEDVISLADAISALCCHFNEQVLELERESSFRSRIALPSRRKLTVPPEEWGRLLALCDHFLARNRLAYASRVLMVAEIASRSSGFHASDDRSEADERRRLLEKIVDRWCAREDAVNQDMYHCALIILRMNPSTLVETIISHRRAHIEQLLSEKRITQAIAAIDAALFVLSQLTGDLCKLRLSRRRLLDTPEFANVPNQWLDGLRSFPDTCYNDEEVPDLSDGVETLQIGPALASSLDSLFDEVSASEACRRFSRIAENVRDAAEFRQLRGVLRKVFAIFDLKLRSLVSTEVKLDSPEVADEWGSGIASLQQELRVMETRTARQVTAVDKAIGDDVAELAVAVSKCVLEQAQVTYKSARDALISSAEAPAIIITSVAALDANWASLGGAPAETPIIPYQRLAEQLISTWDSRVGPDGDIRGSLWRLARAMDKALAPHLWSPALLDVLRKLAIKHLEAVGGDHEAAGALFANSDGDRSRLLLQPLVP